MILTNDTVLVRDDEPQPADIEGEALILSLRAGACFQFNPVGRRIWDLLHKPVRFDAILDALACDYDADAEVMQRDLSMFLRGLIDRGLVRAIERRPAP
jgi:hypothetical protein